MSGRIYTRSGDDMGDGIGGSRDACTVVVPRAIYVDATTRIQRWDHQLMHNGKQNTPRVTVLRMVGMFPSPVLALLYSLTILITALMSSPSH